MFKKLLLVFVVVFLQGCAGDKEVNIGVHPWIGYQPIYIAEQKDLLPKSIKLQHNQSATDTKNQFLNGKIDAGYLTLDEVLALNGQGMDLKVVMIADISAGADQVLAKRPISSREDIINSSIGYEKGAVGQLVLISFLKKYGLSAEDVNLVNFTVDQHHSAWSEGDLDFIISYEPSVTILKQAGAVEVFSSKEMPEMIIDVLAVKSSLIKAGCGVIDDLTDAHFEGLKLLKHSFQDTSYLVADNLGISQKQTAMMMNDLSFPSRQINAEILNDSFYDKTIKVAETLRAAGLIETVPSGEVHNVKCLF